MTLDDLRAEFPGWTMQRHLDTGQYVAANDHWGVIRADTAANLREWLTQFDQSWKDYPSVESGGQ